MSEAPQHGLDSKTPMTQAVLDGLLRRDPPPAFIARYYGFNLAPRTWRGTPLPKCLTFAEAELISMNDLQIVAVYQWNGTDRDDFGYDAGGRQEKGTRDAKAAYHYARYTVQQPLGSAIYFAVDFDAKEADLEAQVRGYFHAVRAFFTSRGDPYRVGVYGSGLVCQALAGEQLVDYTWLAHAPGWSQTAAWAASNLWTIRQSAPITAHTVTVCPDVAKPRYGGFRL